MGSDDLGCSHCKDCHARALGLPCCQCDRPATAPIETLADKVSALDIAAHAALRRRRGAPPDNAAITYSNALERLENAAREYVRTHGTLFIPFRWPQDAQIHIGPLSKVADFAADSSALNFVRWLDDRTGGDCTIIMFQMTMTKVGVMMRTGAEA